MEENKPINNVQNNTPKKERKDQFWKITTMVLMVMLAFFAWRSTNITGNAVTGDTTGNLVPEQAQPTINIDMKELVDDDPYLGKNDAPVTIVEFSDYQCPYCGRFYAETLPQIKSQYIDTGKVKLVFRDFPLSFHPEALPAASAANCANEQGKFWEYHNQVFENQQTMNAASYKQWAEELSLDVAKWEACTKDAKVRAEIQKDFNDGAAAGVQGTPAFIVNGKVISGAQPFTVFSQVIEAELSS